MWVVFDIYKTGGQGEQGFLKLNDILEWEPMLRKWKRLGTLKQGRYFHGISVIKFNDLNDYCT